MSEAATHADPLEELKNTNSGVENKKMAMWAFLASDCMFFGTLISTHLIYRKIYPTVVDPTSIFSIEINTWPTTRNTPSINQICDQSGFPSKLNTPPQMPPIIMARKILLLRLIGFLEGMMVSFVLN